jgi:hypothetical protein
MPFSTFIMSALHRTQGGVPSQDWSLPLGQHHLFSLNFYALLHDKSIAEIDANRRNAFQAAVGNMAERLILA